MDGQKSWENVASGVIATVGPLVGAGLCSAWDVPWVAPAALAAAAVAGVAVRDRRSGRPWSERAFRLATGLAAGAWTTWSSITDPWHLPNLVAGAGAALFGLFVAPAFVGEDAPGLPDQPGQAGQPGHAGRRGHWKALIEHIARVKPITITDDPAWPNQAGFNLHVEFAPGSGDSWISIRDAASRLAAAARLPKGCAISVQEGDFQGTAIVRIPTVYSLAGEVMLPEDVSPASVWDDHSIGLNEDTSLAEINVRQAAALIVGMRGSGKSNLEKVIIARLLRCEDNLTWVVDLNGGGLAVPFMLPYAKGEVDVPPIDWVADTVDEAILMAQVAAAIVKDRKSRYAGLTAASGGDLLPVTADLPQITIVVDEGAEVENNPAARAAMDRLQEILRIGRADAVNVLFSGLRGTQDMMPVPVRKQTTLKICGIVEDDTEVEYVLPGSRVRSEDLVHPGTFFMRRSDRGKAVRQIKVYRAKPQALARVAIGTAHLRHPMDPAGQQVGGRVYAERMQRLQPWLDRLAGKSETGPTDAQLARTAEVVARAVAAGDLIIEPEVHEATAASTPADRDAQRAKAREGLRRMAARTEVSQMPKDQLDDVFGSLVADLRPAEQDGEGWRPELLIDVAREAGPEGIGPTEMQRKLADRGITVSMKTINKWAPRYASEGKLRKLDGGKYAA